MKCPGQETQYWDAEAIYEVHCPKCSASVEFYKDDTNRKCQQCGHRFVNPKMDFGCAAYCQFAEQCLGTLPEDFAGVQDSLLKDKVAVELKRILSTDFHRISKAVKVARYAEDIAKSERANLPVILCAAYLLHLPENSEKRDISTSTTDPARNILDKLNAKITIADAVCDLIASHVDPADVDNTELLILRDAVNLAALEDQLKNAATKQLSPPIDQQLHTRRGVELAGQLLAQYQQQ